MTCGCGQPQDRKSQTRMDVGNIMSNIHQDDIISLIHHDSTKLYYNIISVVTGLLQLI